MKLSSRVRPISYIKAHALEVIRELAEDRQPVIVTLHGEARAVLQDIATFDETLETLALLKILSLTNKGVQQGKTRPAGEAFQHIRHRVSG